MQARLLVPTFLVILAISAPRMQELATQIPRRSPPPVPPWFAVITISAVPLSILNARFAIYDLLHLALGQRPSEGLLLGVLVIAGGLGLIPALKQAYRGSKRVGNILSKVVAFGIMLVILRPPLPYKASTTSHTFTDSYCHNSRSSPVVDIWQPTFCYLNPLFRASNAYGQF